MELLNLPLKNITASYKFITPAFIHGVGADKQITKINVNTFKGIFRFWWRALIWGQIINNKASEENKYLKAAYTELHYRESKLFGSSAKNEDGEVYGVGRFKLNIKMHKNNLSNINSKQFTKIPEYLGFGLLPIKSSNCNFEMEKKAAIKNSLSFEVTLNLSADIEPSEIFELKNTLKIIGLFGGVGARSRRGFGSLQLIKLNDEKCVFSSIEAYKKKVDEFFVFFKNTKLAEHTAFTKQTLYKISATTDFSLIDQFNLLEEKYRVFKKELKQIKKNKGRDSIPIFLHLFELEDKSYGYCVLSLPSKEFRFEKDDQVDFLNEFE